MKHLKLSIIILFLSLIILVGASCSGSSSNDQSGNSSGDSSTAGAKIADTLDPGKAVQAKNGEIKIPESDLQNSVIAFYNTKTVAKKTVYFFVVKDKNGVFHAAANACKVCFGTGKGFRLEGDEIVCNNCGNRYPLEKIATEKGGCNPGPINPNVPVKDGNLIIKSSGMDEISDLFLN